MKSTIKISTILVSLAFLAPATVMAETIDFSTLTNGTAVTSQFNGVTFSLQGGTSNGAPITSSG